MAGQVDIEVDQNLLAFSDTGLGTGTNSSCAWITLEFFCYTSSDAAAETE